MEQADDDLVVTAEQVAALLADQFPQWAGSSVRPIASAGTDHAMFRVGHRWCARLPRRPWAVGTLRTEARWLPVVAPQLPAATPVPEALGDPGRGYPYPWTVCRWVPGTSAEPGALVDPTGLAHDLARFIAALHAVDPTDAPPTVWSRPLREEAERFDQVLGDVLPRLPDPIDAGALRAAWDVATAAAPAAPTSWVHGDLAPGNLLLDPAGRLHGVIDFSMLGRGDPAHDLRPGWNLLPPEGRATLRRELDVDDDTWSRGRGWVLLQALMQLHHYLDRNPILCANARLVLDQIVAEVQAGLV